VGENYLLYLLQKLLLQNPNFFFLCYIAIFSYFLFIRWKKEKEEENEKMEIRFSLLGSLDGVSY